MSTSKLSGWLLLLYSLPARQTGARVGLWRKLRKIGALSLRTSAHVLPDTPAHYERFQWFSQQARDSGGEATLVRATQIEGMTNEDLAGLFNKMRAADYTDLA